MNDEHEKRVIAMRHALEGEPPRRIYTSWARSSVWFFKWKKQYDLYGLEGLQDLSKAPNHPPKKTPDVLETVVVKMRQAREKRERDETKYALKGAVAIHKELQELGYCPPSVRTVHKSLARHGLIVSPPESKAVREIIEHHYPACDVTKPGQLPQLDWVGPRYLTGSSQKYHFYNLRDACSRRIAIDLRTNHKASSVVNALITMGQRMGIPTILQHDNALEFRGSNRYPHSAGILTKFCLALGVESVFIPSRQPYRNGTIENFNGLFQQFVLKTQTRENEAHLQQEGTAVAEAANTRHPHTPLNGKTSAEDEQALGFVPQLLPNDFTFSSRFRFKDPPKGKVSFICRIRQSGKITIASEKFEIDPELAWDYVDATIFVKERTLRIYHKGEMIKEFPYELNTTLRL